MHDDFNELLRTVESDTRHPHEVFEVEDHGTLAVVLCHFNPCAYSSPVQNLDTVLKWLLHEQIPTYAIELRCGLSSTKPSALPLGHRKVVQFDSRTTMFLKDNLWNIAERNLPAQFQHVLCIDADTILVGHDWKRRLLAELEATPAVQPFSKGFWTDSSRTPFKEKHSSGFAAQHHLPEPHVSKNFHPGFAIALRRDFWTSTGGFFNSPIGGGSLFLISALLGLDNELESSLRQITPHFLEQYFRWAASVCQWSGRRLSFVECDAYHLWHGSRAKRRYAERFQRLNGFDPAEDIVTDSAGLEQWSPYALLHKKSMIDGVAEYFFERDEDECFASSQASQ
jgi:hypothetical protein